MTHEGLWPSDGLDELFQKNMEANVSHVGKVLKQKCKFSSDGLIDFMKLLL